MRSLRHKTAAPDVSTCANHACGAAFARLGEGELFAFAVRDPERLGLPKNLKQKVLWLCAKCSDAYTVDFDEEAGEVHLRRRHRAGGQQNKSQSVA